MSEKNVIEIHPSKNGWKVAEGEGVGPVFRNRDHAVSYAQQRGQYYSDCEIRLLDEKGEIAETFEPHDPNISGISRPQS